MKSLLFLLLLAATGCIGKEDAIQATPSENMYFPSTNSSAWETTPISSLGWNLSELPALRNFLIQNNSKSFMILVNGRIVMEEYFDGHAQDAVWQWNSAGKTLVASIAGIAEQEGLIGINNSISQYIGSGWTGAPREKEDLISIQHLLTMSSGLRDSQLLMPATLTYLADAGSRWSYSNVFQRLMDVVAASSEKDFETYFDENLKNKIGMDGHWNKGIFFTIYHSTTRSMARFGLLALNNGKWMHEQIINEPFFIASITSSQNINPSYGYFWWLNGKTSYMLPGSQTVFQGSIVPDAPSDMYAAMGAADQRIYIIPGKNMVIIRMGKSAALDNTDLTLSGFDNELWKKINTLIE